LFTLVLPHLGELDKGGRVGEKRSVEGVTSRRGLLSASLGSDLDCRWSLLCWGSVVRGRFAKSNKLKGTICRFCSRMTCGLSPICCEWLTILWSLSAMCDGSTFSFGSSNFFPFVAVSFDPFGATFDCASMFRASSEASFDGFGPLENVTFNTPIYLHIQIIKLAQTQDTEKAP